MNILEDEDEFLDHNLDFFTWSDVDKLQVNLIKSNIKDNEELPF